LITRKNVEKGTAWEQFEIPRIDQQDV